MDTQNTHLTQVTIQVTKIKVIDENNNDEVKTVTCYGKLNATECKQQVKDSGLTYVSKEVEKDTFEVDTKSLLDLKI